MSARLRATYLTGENIYIRAFVLEDSRSAAAWSKGPFPVNGVKAEEFLREAHRSVHQPQMQFALVLAATDAIVGGVTVWSDGRVAHLTFNMAPWLPNADALRAEALRLLTLWLRDELEVMTTVARVASDEPLTIAAAEELGMLRTATLRQWLARPGGRVDQHRYEALNPNWRVEGPADA